MFYDSIILYVPEVAKNLTLKFFLKKGKYYTLHLFFPSTPTTACPEICSIFCTDYSFGKPVVCFPGSRALDFEYNLACTSKCLCRLRVVKQVQGKMRSEIKWLTSLVWNASKCPIVASRYILFECLYATVPYSICITP